LIIETATVVRYRLAIGWLDKSSAAMSTLQRPMIMKIMSTPNRQSARTYVLHFFSSDLNPVPDVRS
jgi:hypothetical protein